MSTSTTYGVAGMTCGHCVSAVTEELTKLSGVREVTVAFATAFTAGGAADPITTPPGAAHRDPEQLQEVEMNGHDSPHAAGVSTAALPGPAVSQDGCTLVPARTELPSGTAVPFRFTVTGLDGAAVRQYREEHEKQLHLIVVRTCTPTRPSRLTPVTGAGPRCGS